MGIMLRSMKIYVRGNKLTQMDVMVIYLFIGQNRGRDLVHLLGVKWYLSFSCTVSHHTEIARMYIRRQYHGYVHLPTRQELRESNHPKDVIGVFLLICS